MREFRIKTPRVRQPKKSQCKRKIPGICGSNSLTPSHKEILQRNGMLWL